MRRHINSVQFAAPRATRWRRKAAAAQMACHTTLVHVRPIAVYEANALARRAQYVRRLARGAPGAVGVLRITGSRRGRSFRRG